MDDMKFGEEVMGDVHRIGKEQGKEACEKYIHDLLADQGLGLTRLQELSLARWAFRLNKDYINQLACYDETIQLENGTRSGSFFLRGRLKFKLKEFEGALNDFSQAIILEEQTPEKYGFEVYFFLRAEVYLKMGRVEECLLDLQNVPEDYECWTYKLRTKVDLLSDIHQIKSQKIGSVESV